MKLQINLAAVPDKVPVVAPGEYQATIEKIEQKEAAGKMLQQISFQFKIASDGPEKTKVLFDGFPNEFLTDLNSRTTVKLGHLIKSTGVAFNGSEIDFDELLNKTVTLVVAHTNGTDATGSAVTYANIKDYIHH